MKDKNSTYKWAVLSKILGIIATIISTAFINRALGVNMKGEYAYIINVASIMYVVLSFGIGTVYSTFKKRKQDRLLNVLFSMLLFQTIIIIIASLALVMLNMVQLFWIFLITAGCVLKSNLLTIAAIEDVKKRDKQTIVYHFIYFILTTVMFVWFRNNISIALIIYFADTIITSLGIIISYKLRVVNIFKPIKISNVVGFARLSIPTMLMQLTMVLNYNLDIIMLKNISGVYSVGLYSVAVNLGNMLWLIPDAFKDVVLHSSSREDNSDEIVSVIKVNIIISLVITILFALLGRLFIELFYGRAFIDSFVPTLILFIGNIAMIIYKIIHPLYISNGKQGKILKTLLASVTLNVLLNMVFIPHFNIYGAVIASVFSYSLCSLVFLLMFKKDYNIKISQFLIKKNDFIIILKTLKKCRKASK